jgi:hypothetical protein
MVHCATVDKFLWYTTDQLLPPVTWTQMGDSHPGLQDVEEDCRRPMLHLEHKGFRQKHNLCNKGAPTNTLKPNELCGWIC